MFSSFLLFEQTHLYRSFVDSLGDNQPLQSVDECKAIQDRLYHMLQYDPTSEEDSSFVLNYIDREDFDFSSPETLKLFIRFVNILITKVSSRLSLAKAELMKLEHMRERDGKRKFDPKETVLCNCGIHYTKANKTKHLSSKKHKDLVSALMLEKEITELRLKI
jgi:hypothetical protein